MNEYWLFSLVLHARVGQEQPQVARGRPPIKPEPPIPVPWVPVPAPPQPRPHSLLQTEPRLARGRPPIKPEPPIPVPRVPEPRPPPEPPIPVPGVPVPRPPPHSLLQTEPRSETCYPNNNKLSPTGCEQMCKKNGIETKHSYYIERQDAKWECCCPH